MKLKSYTIHYYDQEGKRKKKVYPISTIIRTDQDAKNLFYKTHSVDDVIFITMNY